ncbi:MAG: ABC transporter permease [Verrucomicrobia bacterium]|jgi:lipopolysaccharide transport system permease protein|nr:ABC transporter permease [Verrucomicrobiota bacterium]
MSANATQPDPAQATFHEPCGSDGVPEVVYSSDRLRNMGWRIWGVMLRDLVKSRGLTWRLFYRSWSAQYRQSWLGYVWAVIPPLVAAAAFSFAVRNRVLNIGPTPISYVCYALWGMTVWQLFTGIYTRSAMSLTGASNMISRINFPKDTLVFASLGQPVFTFGIRLVAIAVVFGIKGVVPAWTAPLALVSLLPLVLIALGLGMVMSVVSAAGTDVSQAVGMLLNFGLFLTPVIYPPPTSWPAAAVNVLNPLSPVLATSHALLHGKLVADPLLYGMSWVVALLVFGVGWRIFRASLPRIAERF